MCIAGIRDYIYQKVKMQLWDGQRMDGLIATCNDGMMDLFG